MTNCPVCGARIDGFSARAPGRRTADPCGHELGFQPASELMFQNTESSETVESNEENPNAGCRLITDGGRPEPVGIIEEFIRDNVDAGDWCVYSAKRVAKETELTGQEAGYWFSRIVGADPRFDPIDLEDDVHIERFNTNSSVVRWKVERYETEQGTKRLVADGGVRWGDLTEFQQRCLQEAIAFERAHDEPPIGLDLKEATSEFYETETNHGRLYPNLDTLVGYGLIEKGQVDRRSNYYAPTPAGRELVRRAAEDAVTRVLGGEVSGIAVTDGGEN
ncbi:Transcriptional regulator PadR-like family protein [Halogeometricum rufum]|uniref:Transcriptional regulator PadR-like family protein n=1 Tax=Halogeometricum rufum TaxID=553469 RepID=A0A1I6G1U1_9EURY|nr:Transcriptional regulator PadR-like family protein [Halogeometricum rufum]